jgi:hypothetical protein
LNRAQSQYQWKIINGIKHPILREIPGYYATGLAFRLSLQLFNFGSVMWFKIKAESNVSSPLRFRNVRSLTRYIYGV